MTKQEEKEKVLHNITVLQDTLNEFFYATDYFGLSKEIESNKAIKRILDLAHKLHHEINFSDFWEK